jgi:phosphomannomutase
MAKVNPKIFRAYDIRGIYGKDFDESFAFELGNKLASYFKKGKVIIGRDGRETSDELERAVIDGARDGGADVISIGECTTPLFDYSVNEADSKGGIMVTASHNPGEYNGFKTVGEQAVIISGTDIKDILKDIHVNNDGQGNINKKDYTSDYAERVKKISGFDGNELMIKINAPECVRENISEIGEEKGGDLVAHFDTDGDRIVFEEDGRKIPPDFIFALLLERLGYESVVYDLMFSMSVKEKIAKLEIEGYMSKVGRVSIHENMIKQDAEFGGEFSGHFYFRDFHYLEAPELVLLFVLKILKKERKSLTELVSPYAKYFRSRAISIEKRLEWDELLRKLKKHYSKYILDEMDGLTVENWSYPSTGSTGSPQVNSRSKSEPCSEKAAEELLVHSTDSGPSGWWFNIRPSNTEPILRLIVEAVTKELLDKKLQEVVNLIQRK